MRKSGRDQLTRSGIPLTDLTKLHHHVGVDGKGTSPGPDFRNKNSEPFTHNAQNGVLKIEATTTVWTQKHLILAYVLIWIIMFVESMLQSTVVSLIPYVTSHFNEHSLTGYTFIMSSIVGGVLKLPLAKLLDIWGRPQGFMLMVGIMVLGLVMMAACNTVHIFAAAEVFHWVGYNGVHYSLAIFVADTSSLKNRGLVFGFISSPFVATAWISGPLATAFLESWGWRWPFGIFAIATLCVTIPLYVLFQYNYAKAIQAGIIVPSKRTRTLIESIKHYTIEFDVGGLCVAIAGMVIFLLPFNLFSIQENEWTSPLVISTLITGFFLLIGFVFYERYVAPKTIIPYRLLIDRTVIGACLVAAIVFASWYLWRPYFPSFLQVVNGLDVTHSTYILNIYSVAACFFSLFVGLGIRYTGRYKWIALYFGVPTMIVGLGSLIHFRQPDDGIGFIVMTQLIIAFAGGACVISEQIAIMAATDHQYMAVVLAIEGMFASVGGGIGSSIAVAIWTSVFPKKLAEYLPPEAKDSLWDIYASLNTQLSYPKGTPTRDAIELAYSDVQEYMNIAATAILVLAFPAVLMWRDIRVKGFKQTRGRVV